MESVKRPGSAEARLERHEPSPVVESSNLIDLSLMGAPPMAAKNPAPKTGTYRVGTDYFLFHQGEEHPKGAVFIEDELPEDPEERSIGAAPENRALDGAPENRAAEGDAGKAEAGEGAADAGTQEPAS